LDNVLIFSNNLETHQKHVSIVLERLQRLVCTSTSTNPTRIRSNTSE
jgi:hypothetical protein